MNAALYIRVSTDEQANEGFSIEAQKRRLIAYAESQDWQIYDIFIDDGYSAKDLNRPAMQQMIKDIKSSLFDVVLVYKLDRMTRSTSDCNDLLKLFEKHSVKFQSCTESFETRTAAGRLFIRLVADIAQWERETIAERVRMGMEQKALEGKRPGGVIPYGYDNEGNLIPDEAELIRSVRELYVEGDGNSRYGFRSIAALLNRQGKLRRGSLWTAATVKYTLENPYYAGIILFGSKTSEGKYASHRREERSLHVVRADGKHPTIFTSDEYEEVRNLMSRFGDYGYSRNTEYWFSGILRCGKCGSHMFGRLSTKRSRINGDAVRTPYYMCNNRHRKGSCDMPMFRQIHVEHLVLQYIKKIRTDYALLKQETGQSEKKTKQIEKEIARLKQELKTIQDRRKKWQYLFAENAVSLDDLKARTQEENEREVAVQSRIQVLADTLDSLAGTNTTIKRLNDFEEIWSEIEEDAERAELIRSIFRQITLYTDQGNVKGVKNKMFPASIMDVEYN